MGIVAVAVAVGAAGCMLGAAHLAVRVAGRPPLRASLADAAVALVRMPSSLDDPVEAWPAPAREALPGPIAFYGSLAVVVVVAAGLAIGALVVWRRLGRARHPLGLEPHAGLARVRDLRLLRVRRPRRGRLTLGRVSGQLLAAEPQASLAVVGPTGCGKTAGFAIPAMLEWQGPVIATSGKGDLVQATIARRQRLGKVWVFDPTGVTAEPCAGWSPLGTCGTWGGAIRMAAWLTEATEGRLQSVTDEQYWNLQSRKTLAPHLYAAALSGGTMRDVVRWIDAEEEELIRRALQGRAGVATEVERLLGTEDAAEERRQLEPRLRADVLAEIRELLWADGGRQAQLADKRVIEWPLEMQEQLDERVATRLDAEVRQLMASKVTSAVHNQADLDALVSVESLWRRDGRLRGSVYGTVQNALLVYADPLVADATAKAEIDVDEWLAGPNTIYVVANSHEQTRLRPLFTVLMQAAVRRAYEVANANGGTLPHPCLVLLDEAGNIAPLRDLPGYAATARSHGISLVTVWQDLAQIRSIYGYRAPIVINNHRAKIFGSDNDDPETLEWVSRLVGDRALTERNFSADLSGGRRSVSEHHSYRRALPVDVLRRLGRGNALLIYGSLLPAHLQLRPWYRDRALRALAGKAATRGGRR